jgi:hypothetical protein
MQAFPHNYPSPSLPQSDPFALPTTPSHEAYGYHGAWPQPAMEPMAPPMDGGVYAMEAPPRKVRWWRLLLVGAGVAMLLFSISNMVKATDAGNKASAGTGGTSSKSSIGGSSDTLPLERTVGGDDTPVDPASAAPVDADLSPGASSTPATVTGGGAGVTHSHAAQRHHGHRVRRTGSRGNRRAGRRAAGALVSSDNARAAARRTRSRQGARAAGGGALPHTGLSVWWAALLGMVLLGGGVLMQVHAVRIAATAVLYRRGPLLRPTWYVQTAAPRAIELVREWAPGAAERVAPLVRLLQSPTGGSDYTSTRRR